MKKSLILLSILGLFLAGCSENDNSPVAPSNENVQDNDYANSGNNAGNTNNNNNNNQGSNSADNNGTSNGNGNQDTELNANVQYHIETICFQSEESLDLSTYFNVTNNTKKEISSTEELNFIYDKVQTAKDNNLVSFIDGGDLKGIDLSNIKIVLFPIIHTNTASFFTLSGASVVSSVAYVTLTETVEVDNDAKYTTVGFVYVIMGKNDAYGVNVTVNRQQSGDNQATFEKPIIYFYPEKEMDLSIEFVNEDKLLTTYPKYNGGWDIHLNEDGTFVTKDNNREYYAIYFDEIANYTTNFEEGFYVNKDNAISFLEEKMDYIGYTNREVDEFIMYWLPILESNEHSLVYFEQTEQRNEECPLIFSTQPDTLIRTMIHIKKVDGEVSIPEQQLKHYDRNGFVVTEWGGVEY